MEDYWQENPAYLLAKALKILQMKKKNLENLKKMNNFASECGH